jgi:hypothetical protein
VEPTRLFAIISLIALPTVMYGGYALRRLLESGEELTEFRRTYFRAGHAHAGVLQVLALVYYQYLAQTSAADGSSGRPVPCSWSASSPSPAGSSSTWPSVARTPVGRDDHHDRRRRVDRGVAAVPGLVPHRRQPG